MYRFQPTPTEPPSLDEQCNQLAEQISQTPYRSYRPSGAPVENSQGNEIATVRARPDAQAIAAGVSGKVHAIGFPPLPHGTSSRIDRARAGAQPKLVEPLFICGLEVRIRRPPIFRPMSHVGHFPPSSKRLLDDRCSSEPAIGMEEESYIPSKASTGHRLHRGPQWKQAPRREWRRKFGAAPFNWTAFAAVDTSRVRGGPRSRERQVPRIDGLSIHRVL